MQPTSTELEPLAGRRYRAFISYSHRDGQWAGWLHRKLERYRLPHRLVGRPAPGGPVPRRFYPVFLDRNELASAVDLSETVQTALAASDNLIVICSPDAANSFWVRREIEVFAAQGKSARIFCLIVGGDPEATNSADQCFPAPLLNGGNMPLAADVRPGSDHRREALLKLVAGMLALPLDELRRREHARRIKLLTTVVTGALAVILVLLVLLVAAVRARQEADAQRVRAETESQTALQTVDFLKSLFAVSNPEESSSNKITARAILDQGAARIESALQAQPEVRGRLLATLGEVYTGLGIYGQGVNLLEQSRALLRGSGDLSWLEATAALAEARYLKGDYRAAEAAYRAALGEIQRRQLAPAALNSRIRAGLAEVLIQDGNFPEAERLLQSAIATDGEPDGKQIAALARDRSLLATLYFYRGETLAAEQEFRRAIDLRIAALGAMHPRVGQDLNSIGAVLYTQGKYAEAAATFERALPIHEATYGPDHPETATLLGNLARIALEQQQFERARKLLERVVGITVRQKGGDHDDLAFWLDSLGLALTGLGQQAAAEQSFRRGMAIADLHQHRNRGQLRVNLADLLCMEGHAAAGRALVSDARPLLVHDYPQEPWRLAMADNVLGGCLLAAGRSEEGTRLLAASYPAIEARWGSARLFSVQARQRQLRAQR